MGTRGPLDDFDCRIICSMEKIRGEQYLDTRVVFTLRDGQKIFAELGRSERQAVIETIRRWHDRIEKIG